MKITDSQQRNGTRSEIAAGKNLNIDCNVLGPTSHFFRTGVMPDISEVVMRVDLEYDSDIFGLYLWHRTPPGTLFTWMKSASNPQWVRGEFAK
jgi:hypothetical protein